jgi:hypothetical protein
MVKYSLENVESATLNRSLLNVYDSLVHYAWDISMQNTLPIHSVHFRYYAQVGLTCAIVGLRNLGFITPIPYQTVRVTYARRASGN